MALKKSVAIPLFLLVVASLAYLAAKGPAKLGSSEIGSAESLLMTSKAASERSESRAIAAGSPAPAGIEDGVIVYYFHATRRCFSYKMQEALAEEAITGEFGEAIKRGLLEWKPINTDEPENRHFTDDYRLFTESIVVVDFRGGREVRHKVLQRAWVLLGEKEQFLKYVRDEVRTYLQRS
ncbi:MAG: hypothetical protein JW759_03095 [Candidatus Coatesbacteria bacterium]|nr:hypothetical protein [Candidatus Coatesbacteria bacterium]